MGWLTDRLEDVFESPIGKLSGGSFLLENIRVGSRAVREGARAIGFTALEREADAAAKDPVRGIGRAASAAAIAYGGWLGAGAMGAGAAGAAGASGAGGTSLATKIGLGLSAMNLASAMSAKRQGAPTPAPVTYMPDPNDPSAQAARRRKAAEIRKRQGRESTILSDETETLG